MRREVAESVFEIFFLEIMRQIRGSAALGSPVERMDALAFIVGQKMIERYTLRASFFSFYFHLLKKTPTCCLDRAWTERNLQTQPN
jgi:hypothetical protein